MAADTSERGASDRGAIDATHVLADLRGVDASLLRDPVRLEALMREAAAVARARVIAGHFHRFGGEGGVTGVLLLAESHLSIHTWPEIGLAAVDAFMCGRANALAAVGWLREAMGAGSDGITAVRRGG